MCPQQWNEPRHDKTNKMSVRPAKTQISLGIRPAWSESLPGAHWVAKDPSFLHADSEDSDQTGRMPRLIWVFAGHTCHFVGYVMSRLKYCVTPSVDSGHDRFYCFANKNYYHIMYLSLCSDHFNMFAFYMPLLYVEKGKFSMNHMSHVSRKPVFRVCHPLRLKPVCSAIETS